MERLKTVNRKIWAIILTVVILLSLLVGVGFFQSAHAYVMFSDGTGTKEDPFIITNYEQLANCEECILLSGEKMDDGYYYIELKQDITVPSGERFVPKPLNNVFLDGNNHSIYGCEIDATNISAVTIPAGSTKNAYGLFSEISCSVVCDLKLQDINIEIDVSNNAEEESIGYYVGTLAGSISNSTISNVDVTGNLSVSQTTELDTSVLSAFYCKERLTIGGIVGYCDSATIDCSKSDVNIVVNGHYNETRIGGCVGRLTYSSCKNVFCDGDIDTDITIISEERSACSVGGIVGCSDFSTIEAAVARQV